MAEQTNYAADAGRITDLAQQIRSGALTASALVERYLARIAAVDGAVQAWRVVLADGARAEAAALDREAKAGRFRGPLHGIPVGIKDIIDVAGVTTLANSRSRAGVAPATADADIVASLRAAGAVILGKTHTTEFAYFDPSPARNPHNVGHTPGGSSSGSGAAVGAGMVPAALGTQTVASVNRPAAYCGVAAFKASTQSTCTHGITALAPHFDTVGFYGATVPDAVALYEAVAPAFTATFDAPAHTSATIVQLEDPALVDCDPAILDRIDRAAAACADAGHSVRKAASPEPWAELFAVQVRVMQYEAARLYRTLADLPQGEIGPKFRELIGIGLGVSDDTYYADRARLAAARARVWSTFADADAILFPAAPTTAPAGLASTGDPRYISPWTALGGPIVTQPAGQHANGLPIGMLVCGRPGRDRALARVACALAATFAHAAGLDPAAHLRCGRPAPRERRGNMKRLVILAALAALGGTPAALAEDAKVCASPKEVAGFKTCADVAKAEAEGEVIAYSTDPERGQAMLMDAFHQTFPKINTKYLRLQAGALYAKVLSERQARTYTVDAMQLSDVGMVLDFQKKGGYTQYISPEMAAFKPEYKSQPEGFWTWGTIIMAGLAYNTTVTPADQAPKSWEDALDPKWADALSVKVSNSGLQHETWYELRRVIGPDYFTKLAALKPRAFDSYVQQYDRLVNRQDKLIHTAQYSGYLEFKAKGAPIAFVNPAAGLPAGPECWGIVSNAPHPHAAQLFMDWLLSVPGQKAISAALFLHSPRADVPPPAGGVPISDLKLLFPADWNDFLKSRPAFVREWDKLAGVR